jgi:sulfate permease, SulP family
VVAFPAGPRLGPTAERPEVKHVVLMCSAVNAIDASALESLEEINHRLADAGIKLHLSEVKGPVMDRLKRTDFLEHLSGRVFLSQYEAFNQAAVVCGGESASIR